MEIWVLFVTFRNVAICGPEPIFSFADPEPILVLRSRKSDRLSTSLFSSTYVSLLLCHNSFCRRKYYIYRFLFHHLFITVWQWQAKFAYWVIVMKNKILPILLPTIRYFISQRSNIFKIIEHLLIDLLFHGLLLNYHRTFPLITKTSAKKLIKIIFLLLLLQAYAQILNQFILQNFFEFAV